MGEWIPKPEPWWADCWLDPQYDWPHKLPVDGREYEVKNGTKISVGVWDMHDSEFVMSVDDIGGGKMFLHYAKGDMFREAPQQDANTYHA